MAYLAFLLVLIALFIGFLALTMREQKRGRRYFATARQGLDNRVARAEFIVTHVDFGAYVRDTAKEVAERAAHDVAHVVLQAVRWAERQLTRAVRALRERRAEISATAPNGSSADAAPAQASDFARTISGFKQELRAQREEAPEARADAPTSAVE